MTHEERVRDLAFGLGQEDGARGRDGMPFSPSPSAAEQAIADLINRKEAVVATLWKTSQRHGQLAPQGGLPRTLRFLRAQGAVPPRVLRHSASLGAWDSSWLLDDVLLS